MRAYKNDPDQMQTDDNSIKFPDITSNIFHYPPKNKGLKLKQGQNKT